MQTPPPGKGCVYIRPLLMGSGPILGLAPAPEYTFLIFASPVRNYFKVHFTFFFFFLFGGAGWGEEDNLTVHSYKAW